ncbi:phage holin family protein [Acetobacteraceae bacterium H6797]|nr:phage holin family protein [Acetobacteraceae bacterium H6797]
MSATDPVKSVPELLGDLVQESSQLLRGEVRLFRAEMDEKITQLLAAMGSVGAAGAVMLAALVILLQAFVGLLVEAGLRPWLAALAVAVLAGILGYVMLRAGLNRVKLANLAPNRTLNQMSQDVSVAKEAVR